MKLKTLHIKSTCNKNRQFVPAGPDDETAAASIMSQAEQCAMTERRVDCFFYGLFMDGRVLANNDVIAKNPRRAVVDDYALFMGARATLGTSKGAKAYGVVFELSHAEINRLYSGPGLEEYVPEAVIVSTLEGVTSPALCYNLSVMPALHEKNPEYASKLRVILEKLKFPSEYVSEVC